MRKYEFQETVDGYDVIYRGKSLGKIIGIFAVNGRHSFQLECDDTKEPRVFRGKQKAAEALHAIQRLLAEAKKRKLSRAELIVRAWADRPAGS